MKFISLVDTKNQNIITIDAYSLVIRLERDEIAREKRLKPYMAAILYELFNQHPSPLFYDRIIEVLKEHHLIISDLTRMHRKLSEIRQYLLEFDPHLSNFLLNTRGLGYSLPLRFKNLHQIGEIKGNTNFKNPNIIKTIEVLNVLISDAIDMTAKSKVIKQSQGYVINRNFVKDLLVEKIVVFNQCEKVLLKEIRLHEADFTALRITYLLAKLKTYVGLARISEYPISELQWLDWFKQEVWMLFDDIKSLIRSAES
jgi:hypothetical protein